MMPPVEIDGFTVPLSTVLHRSCPAITDCMPECGQEQLKGDLLSKDMGHVIEYNCAATMFGQQVKQPKGRQVTSMVGITGPICRSVSSTKWVLPTPAGPAK